MEPVPHINDRTTALLGFDLQEAIRNAKEKGIKAAKARALAEHLDHTRKVVVADEINRARRQAAEKGERMTAQEAESMARTSPAYREHLDALRQAQEARGVAYAVSSAADRAVELGFRHLSFLQTELKHDAR
jgi:hypothetical protein